MGHNNFGDSIMNILIGIGLLGLTVGTAMMSVGMTNDNKLSFFVGLTLSFLSAGFVAVSV